MLSNNLDIVVEQANQRRQELLLAAEQQHLAQCAIDQQPTMLGQTFTYVGELLVSSGEWLKRQGELPTTQRTVVTH